MAQCALIGGCPFFNDKIPVRTILSGFFKKKYCLEDYPECARYRVRQELGKENVPPDLFPNQSDEANLILEQAKAEK